jgi:hypothetical protein
MAISGVGTSFKLDNISNVLTQIATFLDSVQGSGDTDQLDGTTFQPGVAVPVKTIIPGFSTKGYSLSGKWSAAAETFFSAIEGQQGLDYEYGPDGTATGKTKISGLCSCYSYSGPQSSVDGITTFTVELSVSTRVVAVF